jgi:MFS family permease
MIRTGGSPGGTERGTRVAGTLSRMDRSLWAVLIGTFTLRFSTGLTGAMYQFYLAKLPDHGGQEATPFLVGIFAASFYLAELALSPLFGIVSDRQGHHRVMLYGPIFGAVAVILTGLTTNFVVLGGTRLLEGASTAASVPSILGYIAIVTAGNEVLRGKAAARFEGATLSGLGVGFIAGPLLFQALGPVAFFLNAVVYGLSFLIYLRGVTDPVGEREAIRLQHVGLRRYGHLLRSSHIWLLAPTWVAVNASIGLWFSQSLFQLARRDPRFPDQFLLRGFSAGQITVAAIAIAIVFAAGILWWGDRFGRLRRTTIILLGVLGGLALVVAGLVINHTAGQLAGTAGAVLLGSGIAVAIAGLFVLAGATPAAVGLLADISEQFPADRGAIMGLYSVFLALGQIGGALIGGAAASWLGMDGLLIATGSLLLLALAPIAQLRASEHYVAGLASAAVLSEPEREAR